MTSRPREAGDPRNPPHDGAESSPDLGAACPRKVNCGLWIAFIVLMAWYAVGAFPFGGPQGDAIREAAGVEHIARYGWDAPLLTHNFTGCPGVAITLVWLRRWTGVDPLTLLCGLSLVSGCVYTLASAGMIRRLTGVPAPLAGMVLLLAPVALMAGMYPNDMVTAAAFVALSFYLLAGPLNWGPQVIGAICLGVAGWYRADAALLTPAIPLILYRGNWRTTAGITALVGLLAGTVAWVAVQASGSDILAILRHAEEVTREGGRTAQVVGCYLSLFPLLLVYLIVLGIGRLVRERAWRLLGATILGIAPLWCVMANFPYPKYFTYVVPWFALVASVGLFRLWTSAPFRRRRWHFAAIAILFVGQYVFGVQLTLRDKPWRPPPEPTPCRIVEKRFSTGRVDYAALVIGPGTLNPFGHAGTPVSGILFTPLAISREQRASREFLDECVTYVDGLSAPQASFFSRTQDGLSAAMYGLVRNGYRCVEKVQFGPSVDSWRCRWQKDGRQITHYRIYAYGYKLSFLPSVGEWEGTYFGGTGAEEAQMLEQTASAKLITRHQALFTRTIYEVTFAPPNEAPRPAASQPSVQP